MFHLDIHWEQGSSLGMQRDLGQAPTVPEDPPTTYKEELHFNVQTLHLLPTQACSSIEVQKAYTGF